MLVAHAATPFDVVTRRLQSQQRLGADGLAVPQLRGSGDMVRQIARTDGVRGLWRGLVPTLVMTVPATAFYFTTYQTLKLHLEKRLVPDDALWSVPLVAGPIARAATVLLSSPLELARTNLQTRVRSRDAPRGSDDMLSLLRSIARTGGVRGLLAGVWPTLWRDVPFSAAYWLLYEQALARLRRYGASGSLGAAELPALAQNGADERPVGFVTHFVAGASAGCAASLLTHPFDVIKTRRQAQLDAPRTAWQIARLTLQEDGVAGFYRGTAPRLARVTAACAIMIASYNKTLQVLHEQSFE